MTKYSYLNSHCSGFILLSKSQKRWDLYLIKHPHLKVMVSDLIKMYKHSYSFMHTHVKKANFNNRYIKACWILHSGNRRKKLEGQKTTHFHFPNESRQTPTFSFSALPTYMNIDWIIVYLYMWLDDWHNRVFYRFFFPWLYGLTSLSAF